MTHPPGGPTDPGGGDGTTGPGRLAAYLRRIAGHRSPLSSKHRVGSRANKLRRTVPTFASDRQRAA